MTCGGAVQKHIDMLRNLINLSQKPSQGGDSKSFVSKGFPHPFQVQENSMGILRGKNPPPMPPPHPPGQEKLGRIDRGLLTKHEPLIPRWRRKATPKSWRFVIFHDKPIHGFF